MAEFLHRPRLVDPPAKLRRSRRLQKRWRERLRKAARPSTQCRREKEALQEEGKGPLLRLFLNPTPCRAAWPAPRPSVALDEDYKMAFELDTGEKGKLLLDSGSSDNFLSHLMAQRLGILGRARSYRATMMNVPEGELRCQLGLIRNLSVRLCEVDRSLQVDVNVLPEFMDDEYRCIFILGFPVMHKLNLVQAYDRDGPCKVYLPEERASNDMAKRANVAHVCKPKIYVLEAHFTPDFTDRPVKVLVDTGFATTNVYEKLVEELGLRRFPKRIVFPVGGGDHVCTTEVTRVRGNSLYPIIFGRSFFEEYSCILDYSTGALYLKDVDRVYLAQMKTLCAQRGCRRNEMWR